MRQAGVTVAAQRPRKERAWVDFGVQDSWEPAPRRRRPLTELDVPPARRAATGSVATAVRPAPADPASSPAPVRAPDEETAPAGPTSNVARSTQLADTAAHSAQFSAPVARSADRTETAARPADFRETIEPASGGPEARRTVTIRGRGAERDLAFPEYRSARRPATPRHERPGFKPDRTALWAVLLGLLLVFVAVASAHASVLAHHVH